MEHWIMLLPALLTAAIYYAVGRLVARYPETIAGYNTMSPERKWLVDLPATGRFLSRLLTISAVVALAGAVAALPWILAACGQWIVGISLGLPIVLIVVGAVWCSWRYDRGFMKRFRR